MYSLGRFLRLKYYQLLLNGNPHLLYARAPDTNLHLESAQALISGLNPPKDQWVWSLESFDVSNWQPIAIHTNELKYDDLLSTDTSNCYRLEQELSGWKNSSRYQSLLNEHRHDLQTLRTNTGLEFEDDLDMLIQIEQSLRIRKFFAPDQLPDWLSASMTDRLSHISNVCAQSRYGLAEVQRLYVGRFLHQLMVNLNTKIREHKAILTEVSATETKPGPGSAGSTADHLNGESAPSSSSSSTGTMKQKNPSQSSGLNSQSLSTNTNPRMQAPSNEFLNSYTYAYDDSAGLTSRWAHISSSIMQPTTREPNVYVYVLDRQRFIALLNSLHIYTNQPQFGAVLLVELHYDPITFTYFLRFLTSSSDNPVVISEPLRLNPLACGEGVECEPQQFEQNLRHLMLDRETWREGCTGYNLVGPPINLKPPSETSMDKQTIDSMLSMSTLVPKNPTAASTPRTSSTTATVTKQQQQATTMVPPSSTEITTMQQLINSTEPEIIMTENANFNPTSTSSTPAPSQHLHSHQHTETRSSDHSVKTHPRFGSSSAVITPAAS